MNVLITGINGFVGQALTERVIAHGSLRIKGAVRSLQRCNFPARDGVQIFQTGDMNERTDWTEALEGVDLIVHLAARVHLLSDMSGDPLAEFRLVNTAGTSRLAQQAAEAGVKRFVYLSSIKVNGETSDMKGVCSESCGDAVQKSFVESDTPNPLTPYAVSKWEAEELLLKQSIESGMEVVIVRPSLVYGPGVKANFLRLLDLVWKGVPLPLKSLTNLRSMVSVDNLVDFLVTCVVHPKAGGEVFLLSDGNDMSTPEIVRQLAFYMSKPVRLFPCPVGVLRIVAAMLGKSAQVDRVAGSLQIDIGKARAVLDWSPPFTADDGFKKTVKWYLERAEAF